MDDRDAAGWATLGARWGCYSGQEAFQPLPAEAAQDGLLGPLRGPLSPATRPEVQEAVMVKWGLGWGSRRWHPCGQSAGWGQGSHLLLGSGEGSSQTAWGPRQVGPACHRTSTLAGFQPWLCSYKLGELGQVPWAPKALVCPRGEVVG